MAYHLYVRSNGSALVTGEKLSSHLDSKYKYLGEFDKRPDIDDKKYVDGRWVWDGVEPEHFNARRRAYPPAGDLLDALWHAMDKGVLPKVEGFYDTIKAAKSRVPKK